MLWELKYKYISIFEGISLGVETRGFQQAKRVFFHWSAENIANKSDCIFPQKLFSGEEKNHISFGGGLPQNTRQPAAGQQNCVVVVLYCYLRIKELTKCAINHPRLKVQRLNFVENTEIRSINVNVQPQDWFIKVLIHILHVKLTN